jgi:hypothetical protein
MSTLAGALDPLPSDTRDSTPPQDVEMQAPASDDDDDAEDGDQPKQEEEEDAEMNDEDLFGEDDDREGCVCMCPPAEIYANYLLFYSLGRNPRTIMARTRMG